MSFSMAPNGAGSQQPAHLSLNSNAGGLSNNTAPGLSRPPNQHSSNYHLNGTSTPTYLMPTSPPKSRRGSSDGSSPKLETAVGQVPICLVNASITYCGNNEIYAFGGFDQETDEVYNHVLKLDLTTRRWALVDNFGDIPGVRMGHTASFYQGDKLIVFGGENERPEHLNDVIVFDIKTATWTSPEIRGKPPRGRARHASVIYEDKLFVIGGVTGESNLILDDICYLDLKTWTWSRTWRFVARFDHAAWVWGGRLWVFGGLGADMERCTDLWWLDLKGTPSLERISSTEQDSPNNTPPTTGRLNSFAPNAANTQIRSANSRRKPTAPGAISSLKFHSGPYVPALRSGTHFHVYSSGLLLDLVTPSETVKPWECNLSTMEMDSLRWQKLASGQEIFPVENRWHYCTIDEAGSTAWLFGSSSGNLDLGGDNRLDAILTIDLEKYGVLGREATEQNRILASERQNTLSNLGAGLASVFDLPPESGCGSDFIITADMDDAESSYGQSEGDERASEFLPEDAARSPPIHVHRIILYARWPHFQRLYAAKMAEYHTNRMHIPEPYRVVRAFLYYLYTDCISGDSEVSPSVLEVAGMLVMANMYDMPKLRLLCVNRLSRELDVDTAAIIWERAGRTDEDWLKRRAASFCLANWGRIVRSEGFRLLSKQSMIDLCEVVDTEARILTGHEAEMRDILAERYDATSPRRPRVAVAAGGLEDDLDIDEEDGMEIS
ncbi:Rab9 effector protein with kelch motifs [Trichophyton mentagrophytes]|nr:Kelch domain-containing protein domain-containing protein [Trichophyton interdigitale]GBF64389.1 Rab9 effector protein with kelch motifs [Trichophyton mentagrophytes]